MERRWDEALRLQGQVEEEYKRWQRSAPGRLSADDERAIRALASDLPTVWNSDTVTPAERQRITRLLLSGVAVTVDKSSERVDVVLQWIGGSTESHTVSRPVKRYDLMTDYPRLVERLRVLSEAGEAASRIADLLNAEGFRPPKRAERFNRAMVVRLLWHLGMARLEPHGSREGLGADEYRPGELARKLAVTRDAVRRWLRVGWVTARRDAKGHHVIRADAAELDRLRELRRLPRNWTTKHRVAELKKQGSNPGR